MTKQQLEKKIDEIFSDYLNEAEAVIWEMSSSIKADTKDRRQEINKQKSELLHLINEYVAGVIGKDYPTDSQVTSANLAAEQRNDEHAIQRRRAGIGEK